VRTRYVVADCSKYGQQQKGRPDCQRCTAVVLHRTMSQMLMSISEGSPFLSPPPLGMMMITMVMIAANTSNRFKAAVTLLGKQFPIAVCTVRLLILRRKLLAGKCLTAVSACETGLMPRCVLVRYSTLRYRLTYIHHIVIHISHHRCKKTLLLKF